MAVNDASPFNARTALLLVVAGVIAFAALVVASAYAPDIAPGGNGGANALSTSAVGFKGIGDLLQASGAEAERIRDEGKLDTNALLVLTPDPGTDPAELARRLALHGEAPALIVLPKWSVLPLAANRAWVQQGGMLPIGFASASLAKTTQASLSQGRSGGMLRGSGLPAVPAPSPLQTIAGRDVRPLLTDARGAIVLGRIGGGPRYVLADPDLLNNHGLATPAGARAALALLAALGPVGARSVAFDLTLNGFTRRPSLLKLAIEPPFLALTLSLLGAALLAGVQAAFRFGAPVREERTIAFGKAALVENAAALIARAGREHRAGAGYALLTRDAVAAATGAPTAAGDAAVDAYLERLGGGWGALAQAARDADDRRSLLEASQRLYDWRKGFARDG